MVSTVAKFNDGLNIVGLCLVRNEDWIIGASLRAALEWCDQVMLWTDRCTDRTKEIAALEVAQEGDNAGRIMFTIGETDTEHWNEMNVRHQMLTYGRQMGGTHFAIVDADEILTANHLPSVRNWFRHLSRGQLLEVPMVPVWGSPATYRTDPCVWTRARLTLGWRDDGAQGWKPRDDGYQHHNRAPYGVAGPICNPAPFDESGAHPGGVMHLQWANPRRLLAKHVLYRMVDHLRWPGRRTPARLNSIYDEALSAPGAVSEIPAHWWGSYRKDLIDVTGVPWQEAEIRRLINANGLKAFEGLDLKGFNA